MTGEAIANQIIHIIEKAELDIKGCRGQGYDGASNKLSEAVGVLAHFKALREKAVYTHCCEHDLSLVVVLACKLPVIRNVLDKVQEVTQMFIKRSKKKKKMKLLEEVVKQNPHYSSQKVFFNVCVTRWIENLHGYNHFLLTYPYITEALEVIAYKLHLEKYLNWSDSDNESRRRAASALAGISNFEFCVAFGTIVKSLFYLRDPTKKIQGRSLDLYNVVEQVMVARDNLVFARSDEEKKIFFARCFEYASEIASFINVTPSVP